MLSDNQRGMIGHFPGELSIEHGSLLTTLWPKSDPSINQNHFELFLRLLTALTGH